MHAPPRRCFSRGFWFGLGPVRRRRVLGLRQPAHVRRHARAARGIRHRGLLRLPRPVPGGGRLAAGAHPGAGPGARVPADPSGVGAVRVDARMAVHRVSLARDRLCGGRLAAAGLRADRRRLPAYVHYACRSRDCSGCSCTTGASSHRLTAIVVLLGAGQALQTLHWTRPSGAPVTRCAAAGKHRAGDEVQPAALSSASSTPTPGWRRGRARS